MRTENSLTTIEPAAYRPPAAIGARQPKLPTAAQEERRERLKRFNRLVIALPVGLVALLWLALILGMIWLSVAGEWFAMETNQGHYRQLFSGIADIVTMLLLAPMLLLCALPTVGAIALVVYRRQKKTEPDPAEQPKLPIFWRIENKVITLHDAVARTAPKVTRPLIQAHGRVAYIKKFIEELKRILQQEINRYGK